MLLSMARSVPSPHKAVPYAQLLQSARAEEPKLLAEIEALVRIESPSENKAACEHALQLVAGWAQPLGGTVRWHRHKRYADSLEIRFRGSSAAAPALLLGHLDTVWPEGTLAEMPFRVTKEKISGPGVLDMKAGVAMMLSAIRVLRAIGTPTRPLTILLHGDEEIGSPASRAVTEKIARRHSAVYVLEPAQGAAGAYKTARKGIGHYRLDVTGVAAHSGVDFTAGHSAILELAHQIEALSAITDLSRGLTVNPGVIGGGTLSNVIAGHAWAEVDIRIAKSTDAVRVERALARLRPRDRACSLSVSGGINRPPMERTRAIADEFAEAKHHAQGLGFALDEASTGGGSDGNFTAALGITTLDGMGALGAGAHATHEHLLRNHLAPRTALLAAMCSA